MRVTSSLPFNFKYTLRNGAGEGDAAQVRSAEVGSSGSL